MGFKEKIFFFFCFFGGVTMNMIITYLNDMVFEVDILFLFSAPVLNVQNADQISSPATK